MPGIACSLIRGGTSRAAFFHRRDLPDEAAARDALLLRAMGGPDALQVDGIGGGHPLTSKVAVIDRSAEKACDVEYLFLQIDAGKQTVSNSQNCGNILAGVGLFAIEEGLVHATDPQTTVRVRMLNSGALCHIYVRTPNGAIQIEGDTAIDGVPGTAAPIVCNYLDIAGSSCGALLPTGSVVDEVDGVGVTCVDNGMPVVVARASELGIEGNESPDTLDVDENLKARIESIRLQLGPRMGLGDVGDKSVPKMCIVSPPQRGGLINTRTFIPHVCHKTIGVLGAVSAATACLLPGSRAGEIASIPPGNPKRVEVEHAAGSLGLQLEIDESGQVRTAGVVRTGRILFKGEVYV